MKVAQLLRICVAGAIALATALALPALSRSIPTPPASAAPIKVGVFYYPGWSPDIQWAVHKRPWVPIARFPDRMPLAGPYDDAEPATLRRQLDDMKRGNIRFVVFDSYAGPNGSLRSTQAVNAYLATARAGDPQFALMWANHDDWVKTPQDWSQLVARWVQRYLSDPRYLRFNGRPALFIFSTPALERSARAMGSSTGELFTAAQQLAHAHGMPGISFIGGNPPKPAKEVAWAVSSGYAGVSLYGYGPSANEPPRAPGFAGREQRYRRAWPAYLKARTLPPVLPLTSGWDRGPWGGSTPAAEDRSMSTPAEFEQHLRAGFGLLRGAPLKERLAVVCCWNEYGEGSVIEPTRRFGYGHLDALRRAQAF